MHLVSKMAFVGETPWHGLGNRLSPNQPLEVWSREAGMDWSIKAADVRFVDPGQGLGSTYAFPEQQVLYRSDTKTPLSVVSRRFQVVQPSEVLEFYRDLTEVGGFELETAGVLKEGRKLWALAKTGQSALLKGTDRVNGYLLLATACDGTMATTAQFTSVRVVCNNTLNVALRDGDGAIKVGHRSTFDAAAVKRQLGLAISSWDAFKARMVALSECRISETTEMAFLKRLLTYQSPRPEEANAVAERSVKAIHELYVGRGRGATLPSSAGTAFGLLNAVTEFTDHHRRSRSDDNRREAAWFGSGSILKQRAWDEAMRLIA